ncbi:hypothetical protein B6U81_01370 [Thermoplasmatales archaeon ex4484_30]|nr:MAG: hypothetical protein B6U81_01370 [Thermoplasmatales archaeon ex4484_30]
MKEKFIEMICCPKCHGDLHLEVKKKEGDEILEGTFICNSCNLVYPIKEGVPYMLFEE